MTDAERFWSKVNKTSSCWLWTAGVDWDGYGIFSRPALFGRGRSVRASRFAWELQHGSAPGAALVCHRCDTPACVNPDHLFLGTPKDNFHDCLALGRVAPQGEGNAAAKLGPKDIVAIRRLYAGGGLSQGEIAHIFGVKQNTISRIILRKSWAHVPDNDTSSDALEPNHAP